MIDFILYFTAPWCNPCQHTRPIVEQLNAEASGPRFFIIDVEEAEQMAKDLEVESVPTFILFKDDEEVYRYFGQSDRARLESFQNFGKQ